MSHFYGTLNGQARTQATRRGSKNSGIRTVAASWKGAIEVTVFQDSDGRDCFTVQQRQWHGAGVSREIASGVIGE